MSDPVTIRPRGVNLLFGNRQEFKQDAIRALAKGATHIVGDFSGIDYIDASGCGVLVNIDRLCKNAGARFVLTNLSEENRTLFDLNKLDTVLEIGGSPRTGAETSE
jgi:anti-anti-sigma factor